MRLKIKKSFLVFFFFLIVLTVFLFTTKNVGAVGQSYVCAEKTKSGAWCQNVPADQASRATDPKTGRPFQVGGTACESTSFCKVGTCVDRQRGQCRPSVAKRVCEQEGGEWSAAKPDEIDACKLGCCVMGDDALLDTGAGCTSLATEYGVQTDFHPEIRDAVQCGLLSNTQEKGACVIDSGLGKPDCKFITNAKCTSQSGDFRPKTLCTAPALGTRCAPTKKTTCVEGKFGVYFVDSCGNIANIYDASKVNDPEYWKTPKNISESCNPTSTNSGSKTCGNCDYQTIGGSVCKPVERGNVATPQPDFGNFVCADLGCEYKGTDGVTREYKQGEEWCGKNDNLPGSETYILSCYYGKVRPTFCEPFRNSRCIDGKMIGPDLKDYRTASCVLNIWDHCIFQTNKTSCLDRRKGGDCKWIQGEGLSVLGAGGTGFTLNKDGNLVPRNESEGGTMGATCVPKYPPALKFWEPGDDPVGEGSTSDSVDAGNSAEACLTAKDNCIVKFVKRDVFSDWECQENCECLKQSWTDGKANICLALGDCGVKKNFVGTQGSNVPKDYISVSGGNIPGWSDENFGHGIDGSGRGSPNCLKDCG